MTSRTPPINMNLLSANAKLLWEGWQALLLQFLREGSIADRDDSGWSFSKTHHGGLPEILPA